MFYKRVEKITRMSLIKIKTQHFNYLLAGQTKMYVMLDSFLTSQREVQCADYLGLKCEFSLLAVQ